MRFVLEVAVGNSGMQDPFDVAQMLREQADLISQNTEIKEDMQETIFDINGNTVGEWRVEGE